MKMFAAAGALLTVMSLPLGAQAGTSGPRAGAWGAEISFNAALGDLTGGVLRFRNDRSAWVLGLAATTEHRKTDGPDEFFDRSEALIGVTTRLGMRSLGRPGSDVRPILGGGLLGRISQARNEQRLWEAGAYGEFGLARFFGQSFSLGLTGDVHVRYQEQRFDELKLTSIRGGFDSARVTATVIF